ncbi:ATP-binding protein [Patulibacter brassicae]|uniref:histidine kinase n=1 Tax=Patulibacter brassicae TaxID=1705717 RepID=A0ABU4VNK9_9ACTN|nr:ATP-binding protein [Patulibacter brassicae]MDX8153413.1 ATP-binding protein [Patulibacter brassicae]
MTTVEEPDEPPADIGLPDAPPGIDPAELRAVDLFDGLDDEQLARWAAVAIPVDLPAGTIVAAQGRPPVGVHLLLRGTVQNVMFDAGRREPTGLQVAPTWMGAVAVVLDGVHAVQMQLVEDGRIAVIPAEDFRRIVYEQPVVRERVLSKVSPVAQRMAAVGQNRERLAGLGRMAAGLAHELNNPAAAAQRAAAHLAHAIESVSGAMGEFVAAGISLESAQGLVALQQRAIAHAAACTALDALDAADAEDDLQDRLEDLGVERAWKIVEPLARGGADDAWVDEVVALAGPAAGPAFHWIAATLAAQGLASELQESTARISSLVGAIKSYAYVDRGEIVEVDVHEGLETTLVVMGHKLKRTRIEVVRDYDRTLPKLMARGPELNQVWTNLIDNAIQALGESGTITISTRRDGPCVLVDVSDDGPGMPPEVRERVFESFFTTKDVGQGTGLGLSTARSIVVDRHDGSLTVDSEPGRTTFHVWIPFEPGARGPAAPEPIA